MAAAPASRVDVAIVGGGIAGLYLLARLRRAGYGALLMESQALGAGQTIASQGIIHGGSKYAIGGDGGNDPSLAPMPRRWRACLDGAGEVDLRAAKVAAAHQLFWVRRGLMAKVAGLLAGHVARGQVAALDANDWPAALRGNRTVGAVSQLDEMVVDVPSLLTALAGAHEGAIKAIAADWRVERNADAAVLAVRGGDGRQRRIAAGQLIFCAGAGNERALAELGEKPSLAQRRPLHMVMLKPAPAPLWAHCFDLSDKPLLSITSHRARDGGWLWYIGGAVAEKGAAMDEAAQLDAAKKELARLMANLDFSACQFAAWRVDRAEGATADGRKPVGPVAHRFGNITVAWPTKLASAPALADRVLGELPAPAGVAEIDPAWPAPPIAAPPWEVAPWR